jgi:hypothetical protein
MDKQYNLLFHKAIEHEEIPQARRIAQYVNDYIKPDCFLDFGSSTGIYVKEIQICMPQVETTGFEFSEDACNNAVCPNIIRTDLTIPLNLTKATDKKTLGLCLEVLEHIPDENWSEVLSNITKLSDIIIFSAAHPGQGGTGHINCRPKIDWIRRFHSLGWVVDHDHTTHFLNYMTSGYHFGWLRMNAIVLVKG